MKKVLAVLFAFCVSFEHAAFALHNSVSDKVLGWTAGWSWDRGRAGTVSGLTDEDLVEMLYSTTSGTDSADHPTLKERMAYRRTYEVTEEPETDYGSDVGSFGSFEQQPPYGKTSLEYPTDYQQYAYPDNAISQDTSHRPISSSSSMFMSSGDGDSLYTSYSHKIIHTKKK